MIDFNVDAFVEKLEPAVAKVAETLGTGAENLWHIGIMGQFAEGIVAAIGAGAAVILLIVGVATVKGLLKLETNHCNGYGCSKCLPRIIGSILCIAFGIGIFAGNIHDAVMHLAAPEWMLIKEIMSQLGK